MFDISKIVTANNLIIVLGVMGVIQALKTTLSKLNYLDNVVTKAIMPWLPLVLGGASGFIPGLTDAKNLSSAIIMGVALGAVSGQVWKIFKTKLEILGGK
jgi:hypothetical protein